LRLWLRRQNWCARNDGRHRRRSRRRNPERLPAARAGDGRTGQSGLDLQVGATVRAEKADHGRHPGGLLWRSGG
jgi:hypothetical protein